ncbi:MAG: NAD-dependent epimerase [bacterium]|nr:NAD-dependent epimerase [bacterium]
MSYTDRPILVTGAAGFIGFHVSKRLLDEGYKVVGLDIINDYYDINLKKNRLDILKGYDDFIFEQKDLKEKEVILSVFEEYQFEYVVNLAAQAGVRHSLTHPETYVDSNLMGFVSVLEGCKKFNIKHLVYASSSSVYGANTSLPFSENDTIDHPLSLYAATKKCNELMAHAYAASFDLPSTGLRFFTAYGPWGRPDMALFIFTKSILEDKPINVYNNGHMSRDFTYIDDVVEGIFRLIPTVPIGDENWDYKTSVPSQSFAPFRVYNIGNNNPVDLLKYIEEIEKNLGKSAEKNMLPLQVGDVPKAHADVSSLMDSVGYKPETTVQVGINNFINWYRDYYKV